MTEKLLCPFCDSEIEQLNEHQRSLLHCSNIVCCKGGHYIGNISMWRDLIRTRKALGVAVDGITYMRNNCLDYAADYMDYADRILEQIKDNDKDVKCS